MQKLEYDKFEQRAYLLTGNGVEESFTYNAKDRRLTQKTAGDFQDLQYKYDPAGNITALDEGPEPRHSGSRYHGQGARTWRAAVVSDGSMLRDDVSHSPPNEGRAPRTTTKSPAPERCGRDERELRS